MRNVVAGLMVGLGVAAGGYFVGNGFVEGRVADRHVTVRGLSEREVPADLAIWPVTFGVVAGDLPTLHTRLDTSTQAVKSFLEARFPGDEVRVGQPRVEDRGRYDNPSNGENRFSGDLTVTLRTIQPGKLHAAMQETAALVEQGVALQAYGDQAQWLFTQLDSIKPAMIGEATLDARKAADQLARDAGGTVGGIRTATQGYFSIEDRDPFSPEVKRVRVVTTVEYLLE